MSDSYLPFTVVSISPVLSLLTHFLAVCCGCEDVVGSHNVFRAGDHGALCHMTCDVPLEDLVGVFELSRIALTSTHVYGISDIRGLAIVVQDERAGFFLHHFLRSY